jgi:hypothetical protein
MTPNMYVTKAKTDMLDFTKIKKDIEAENYLKITV